MSMNRENKTKKPKAFSLTGAEDYESKLSRLLDRVAIQNKFSNRVVECNIRNIHKRQRAEKELQELYEIRKQEEINEVHLKNLNSELNQQIVDTKAKLDATIIELIKAKNNIKKLNEKISSLEHENISLQVDTFQSERSKIDQIVSIKETLQAESISNEIKKYIETDIAAKNNALYDFCVECFKDDSYANFFQRLEERLYGKLRLPKLRYGSRSIDRASKEHGVFRTPVKSHRRAKTLLPEKL